MRKERWESALWDLYKIRKEEYVELLEKQEGRCAICGNFPTVKRLHVDHDHKTKSIRGLLCHKCNVGLGHFNDDYILLEKAIKYLKR